MFNILRIAFLVTIGLVGFAWKVIRTLAALAPDSVQRIDVPFERRGARYTWDGRTIID